MIKKRLLDMIMRQRRIIKEMKAAINVLIEQSRISAEINDELITLMLNYNLPESEAGAIMEKCGKLRAVERTYNLFRM